ncbi:hypothetical protein V8E36_005650 [Tilletia maclaganii]
MRCDPERLNNAHNGPSHECLASRMSVSLPVAATAPATSVRVADEDVSYSVRLCSSAEDLLDAHKVRCAVFHEEQGFPLETEIDEYDPLSAHFLAIATVKATGHSHPIGVIRWVPYPFPPADPSFQPGANKDLPIGPVRDEATVQSGFARNPAAITTSPAAGASASGGATDAEAQDAKDIADAPTLLPGGKLTRLAVVREARGKHIGDLLVRESEKWVLQAVRSEASAASSGAPRLHSSKLVVSSQLPVIRFYTRLSYVPVSEQYDEEGAPHQRLEKIVVF